jgi:hypothetical protein
LLPPRYFRYCALPRCHYFIIFSCRHAFALMRHFRLHAVISSFTPPRHHFTPRFFISLLLFFAPRACRRAICRRYMPLCHCAPASGDARRRIFALRLFRCAIAFAFRHDALIFTPRARTRHYAMPPPPLFDIVSLIFRRRFFLITLIPHYCHYAATPRARRFAIFLRCAAS